MQTIYNTLTRKKEVFTPIEPGRVKMYVCGPTVYDYFHIGNARTFTVFDMVFRWLQATGYEVNYARNVTDIDDKIIERANENGEPIAALTERMTAAMHELVSPRTRTASGRSSSSTRSTPMRVPPSTAPSEDVSTPSMWSGSRIPRSRKNDRLMASS